MYYTTIPLVSERTHSRRWDASKLRELRKKLDATTITTEEVDNVAADFLDSEIVDLASDWLGNTVSGNFTLQGTLMLIFFICLRLCRSCSRNVPLVLDWLCLSVSLLILL